MLLRNRGIMDGALGRILVDWFVLFKLWGLASRFLMPNHGAC